MARQSGLVFTAAKAVADTKRNLAIPPDANNGDGGRALPAATTFVVGADGTTREEILAALYA